jgi:hypothetical protein
MTYDERRRKYVVRWRENGRRRIARYDGLEEAEAHERRLQRGPAPAEPQNPEVAALAARVAELEAQLTTAETDVDAPGDGVFSYTTKHGTRYGFKFRQSDSARRYDGSCCRRTHASVSSHCRSTRLRSTTSGWRRSIATSTRPRSTTGRSRSS